VEAVQDNFNGDTERTYLTGFSYGGNGVLDIGSKPRDVWAALWAVDPTRVPETGLKRPVWLSAGPYAARQKTAFEDVLDVREVQNNPSVDFVYSFAHPEHPIAAREAYATSEIYRWLLSKRLS
jgi:dienelactone hydrolase